MRFKQCFWMLIQKDLLVAMRSPVWTTFELAIPIALGIAIFQLRLHKGIDSELYRPGDVYGIAKMFSLEKCADYKLYYINSSPDKRAVQSLIDKVPWKEKNEFTTKERLLKHLLYEGEQVDDRIYKLEEIGIEFISFNENELAYRAHSSDYKSASFSFLKPDEQSINPVFSSEFYFYDLKRIITDQKLIKHGFIQLCLIAASQNKSFDNTTFIEYREVDANVYENVRTKTVLVHLHSGLPLLLGPTMIFAAVTITTDKEAGMKEFFVVMGLRKIVLFLETFVFSLLKALLVTMVIVTRLCSIIQIQSDVLPAILLSVTLLCIGTVTTAMLCAAVSKTSSTSVTVSLLAFLAMAYIQYIAPNIYESDFLQYFYLLDIFVAYDKFLNGVRVYRIRGVTNIGSSLFLYDDILNPGTSLLFLVFDITALLTLVLFLDYISIKPLVTFVVNIVSKANEVCEFSENDDESCWHEDNQGSGEPVLVVDSISKIWETTGEVAVKQFSMKAYRGQVTVLLGHNGAGKSTTYAMICGLTPATRGNISVLGSQQSSGIRTAPPPMGFCPQYNCILSCLTVEDHLRLFFVLKKGEGFWKNEANALCTQLGMSNLMKKKAGNLSGGEKRKLCLAMAFIGGSELVMLDEPTVGMDPQSRMSVRRLLEEKKKTIAIILTTHYLDEAEAIGDFVYIMHTGRCVCSGTPYFLKAKFAPDLVLTVVFKQNANEKDVEATKEIVRRNIEGVNAGAMNGNQIRFRLPKNQQNRVPKLLEDLESKQSVHIDSFGLSMKALEEAFLKIGQLKGDAVKNTSVAFMGEEEVAAIHKGRLARILQQAQYICIKKFLESVHNVPLIINQFVLPLTMVVFIAASLQGRDNGAEIYHVPDISLRHVKHGRFIILDESNNTNRRTLLERVLRKYPNLQIFRYHPGDNEMLPEPPFSLSITSNTSEEEIWKIANWMSSRKKISWVKSYPWPVGAVLVRSEEDVSQGKKPYLWVLPTYLYRKEEMLFQLVGDVEFASGKFRVNASFSSADTRESNPSDLEIAALVFCIASVLLNVSFVISLVEERTSNFRNQQFLAGLHFSVFWITTFILDLGSVIAFTGLMVVVLKFFTGTIKLMLMFYSNAFNFSMIPFVYTISLITNEKGRAKCICLAYELCSIFVLVTLHEVEQDVRICAMLLPPASYLSATISEVSPSSKLQRILSVEQTFGFFLLHGAVFMAILFVYELHLEQLALKINKKTYIEKNNIPDGRDVIQEREVVSNNVSKLALAVQDLTKYYGSNCAVKRTTYGIRKDDCFGLVGASGAGKTTTFDIITGVRFASDGAVFLKNSSVNRIQEVGYCPQFDAMLPRLSCRQNLLIIAGIIGYKRPALIVDGMLRCLDLEEHCNKAFCSCSGGQKRRISIGAALLNPSQLVILDEPTAGIDAYTRHHIWSLLNSIRTRGRTLLLSSHSMEECEALCSRIAILVRGRLVAIGTSQELKSRYTKDLFLHTIMKMVGDRKLVVHEVLNCFPSSTLVTKRIDSRILKFKIRKDRQDRISTVYKKAQEMALKLPLEDFFLLQGSLEDVLENLNELHSSTVAKPV